MLNIRRAAVGAVVGAVGVLGFAAPAFAHDCFNPTKDAHAPTGGVHYTITGFDPTTGAPIVEQTGTGQGVWRLCRIVSRCHGSTGHPLHAHAGHFQQEQRP
jgi:hypothetical protein